MRALVVDDSRMVRRVAARILRDLGLDVTEAETGREALDQCRLRMPDVMLLDWQVGDMDGLGVLRALRDMEGGGRAKVVFCTAERSPASILAALEAGADEYIMKPFDADIVHSKLVLCGVLPVAGPVPTPERVA